MRTAIYARVSTESQQQRGTIGSQLEALRQRVAGEGEGVADVQAEVVGGGIRQHHRPVVDMVAGRGEGGSGLYAEHRHGGRGGVGGGAGGADTEGFGAGDPGNAGPLLPLHGGDGGVGVGQFLPSAGGGKGDPVGGQARDRGDVLLAKSGGRRNVGAAEGEE